MAKGRKKQGRKKPVRKKKNEKGLSAKERKELERLMQEQINEEYAEEETEETIHDEENEPDTSYIPTGGEQERLRYKGKYISKEFEYIIRNAAGASGKTPEQLLSDSSNEKALDNIINKNKTEVYKRPSTIIKDLEGHGKVILSDGESTREVSAEEAIKQLVYFESRVRRSEAGIVYVSLQVTKYLDGRTVITIPLRKRLSEEELAEFLEDYTEYIVYDNPQ